MLLAASMRSTCEATDYDMRKSTGSHPGRCFTSPVLNSATTVLRQLLGCHKTKAGRSSWMWLLTIKHAIHEKFSNGGVSTTTEGEDHQNRSMCWCLFLRWCQHSLLPSSTSPSEESLAPQNPMGPTSLIAQPVRGQNCPRLPTVHVELQHWMADNPLTKINPQN